MMLKRFGVKVPSMDSVLNFKVPGLDNFLPLQQVRSNLIQMFYKCFFTLYFSELSVNIVNLSNGQYKFILNYIYIHIHNSSLISFRHIVMDTHFTGYHLPRLFNYSWLTHKWP